MAGAEGFEPPKAVLETAGLPLAYAPVSDYSVRLSKCENRDLPQVVPELLLCFSMRLMLTAERAEFLHLQPFCRCLLILRLAVVAVLTFTALKLNDFAWHF
jgi:hypothetical protein